MAEVQNHGVLFEDTVIRSITGMSKEEYQSTLEGAYVASMDILKGHHSDVNYSVKVSGGKSLGCGDILRFLRHCRDDEFTIIAGAWRQVTPEKKVYQEIYEFDITPEHYKKLFANMSEEVLQEFVDYVKAIPPGREAQLANRKLWKEKRRAIYDACGRGLVTIDAKIDSKNQRRVQCGAKIQGLIDAEIPYRKYTEEYRGIPLPYEQESKPRTFSST